MLLPYSLVTTLVTRQNHRQQLRSLQRYERSQRGQPRSKNEQSSLNFARDGCGEKS